jgi:adenine-specific DNA glycosylase
MEVIKLDKNYNPMFLKNTVKHEFSHFTLFSKVMIIKKEKIIKNSIKGKWVDKNTIKKYPISNLTKKIINYSLEEVASLRKFL